MITFTTYCILNFINHHSEVVFHILPTIINFHVFSMFFLRFFYVFFSCFFYVLSILRFVHSTLCPFYVLSILRFVHSTFCPSTLCPSTLCPSTLCTWFILVLVLHTVNLCCPVKVWLVKWAIAEELVIQSKELLKNRVSLLFREIPMILFYLKYRNLVRNG